MYTARLDVCTHIYVCMNLVYVLAHIFFSTLFFFEYIYSHVCMFVSSLCRCSHLHLEERMQICIYENGCPSRATVGASLLTLLTFVCMYMYVCTCLNVHMCMYIHMYIYICMYVYMRVHTYIFLHVYINICFTVLCTCT